MENVTDMNAHPTNAWPSATLPRINRNSIRKLIHHRSIPAGNLDLRVDPFALVREIAQDAGERGSAKEQIRQGSQHQVRGVLASAFALPPALATASSQQRRATRSRHKPFGRTAAPLLSATAA